LNNSEQVDGEDIPDWPLEYLRVLLQTDLMYELKDHEIELEYPPFRLVWILVVGYASALIGLAFLALPVFQLDGPPDSVEEHLLQILFVGASFLFFRMSYIYIFQIAPSIRGSAHLSINGLSVKPSGGPSVLFRWQDMKELIECTGCEYHTLTAKNGRYVLDNRLRLSNYLFDWISFNIALTKSGILFRYGRLPWNDGEIKLTPPLSSKIESLLYSTFFGFSGVMMTYLALTSPDLMEKVFFLIIGLSTPWLIWIFISQAYPQGYLTLDEQGITNHYRWRPEKILWNEIRCIRFDVEETAELIGVSDRVLISLNEHRIRGVRTFLALMLDEMNIPVAEDKSTH